MVRRALLRGATKSAGQRFSRRTPSTTGRSTAYAAALQRISGGSATRRRSLDHVVVDGVRRNRPITALAVSQRPSTMRFNMRRPSSNTRRAIRRTTSSCGDRRVAAGQVPGLEERAPVDAGGDFGEIVVAEHAPADELWRGGARRRAAIDRRLVRARLRQRDGRHRLLACVLLARIRHVCAQFGDRHRP